MKKNLLFLYSSLFILYANAQGVGNHLTMSLQNCIQLSPDAIQFDLYVISDGAPNSDLRPNSFQYGVNYNSGCIPSGALVTSTYISGTSDFIPPLNTFGFPGSTNGHIKIIESIYGGGEAVGACTFISIPIEKNSSVCGLRLKEHKQS